MKSEKGGVLLFVVILSFGISIITITLLTTMSNTTRTVDTLSQVDLLRQQNSAAIRATIDKLEDVERVEELPASVHVLNRDVLVTVEESENGYWKLLKLKVSHEANDQVHTVTQRVDKKPPLPFNYAIYAEDSIDLFSFNPTTVLGKPYAMYAGNKMELKHSNANPNKADIQGWLSFGDSVPIFNINGYDVDDFDWLQVKPPTFPVLNDAKAKEIAIASNCYHGSDLSIKATTSTLNYQCGEVLYVEGNLTVFGDLTFNGLVVVGGTLQIVVDSNITHGNKGAIFYADQIRIDFNNSLLPAPVGITRVNGILFTPNTVGGFAGRADIDGSIVAVNVDATDQLNVTYDQDLISKIPISIWSLFDGIRMNSFDWKEKVN